MFKFFRRHNTVVMISLAACTLGLLLFGIGGSSMMSSPQDVIARVNGRKITQLDFDRIYQVMQRQQEKEPTSAQQQQLTGQAFNEVIRQQVLSDEAKRYGFDVTDDELRIQLAAIPAFQKDGHFDPATYEGVVRRMFGMSPHEFEKSHKKDLIVRKLNLLVASSVQLSDAEFNLYKDAILAQEKDAKARKELESDPVKLRDRIRDHQINLVFNDWLNRLNAQLKVSIVSDTFRQRLGSPAK